MGSHLLGLRDPSQLQELRKSNNMKLPLILAATMAVSLADPHYLRSYGVGPIHRLRSRFGSFGRYGDQAFRSALASQAFRNNLVSQLPELPDQEPRPLLRACPGGQHHSCHTDRQLLWEAAGANCQSPRSQRRLGLHEELLWQG